MFHLMAYNKDQDRYDEWQAGTLQAVQAEALFCRDLLKVDELRDVSGDVYDWLEIWDDEDDDGKEDVIVLSDKLIYRGNYDYENGVPLFYWGAYSDEKLQATTTFIERVRALVSKLDWPAWCALRTQEESK